MIEFHFETDFQLVKQKEISDWINSVIISEKLILGEINYIFCDDEYILNVNQQYLNHDYYTDIISFDYREEEVVSGDIFISIDRVQDNANEYKVSFEEELLRVIIHGILHFCGYKDKSDDEELLMRSKENEKIRMFHVEH